MSTLDAAYHEVALANSKLRDEIERLRAALKEIASWTIPDGRAAHDVAIRALKEKQ